MTTMRTYPYQVIYADTDAGGVVYYAHYLRMFELARALYIQDDGLTLSELAALDCLFVCRRAEVDYLSPAKLDDRLLIHTSIPKFGRAYLDFHYAIACENRLGADDQPLAIISGITRMVCCGRNVDAIKPKRIPKWLLERLTNATE